MSQKKRMGRNPFQKKTKTKSGTPRTVKKAAGASSKVKKSSARGVAHWALSTLPAAALSLGIKAVSRLRARA